MGNNTVDTKTIASLLDGKNYFYIPSYQRGYRWTHKQVDDLLNDLYSFMKQPETEFKGSFYCLQPVIVKEIADADVRRMAMGEASHDSDNKLWELVDGQQRLTTIYILLRYLITKSKITEEEFLEDYSSSLYHMYYEARPESKVVLEKLGTDEVKLQSRNNIDATHLTNAYHYIEQWFADVSKGQALSKLYNHGESQKPRPMREDFLKLLTESSDQKSVEVIWYQLCGDVNVDPIREFTRINNGRIPLTDTELVKALFLQKRNYIQGDKILQQVKVSMQWEYIENTLQADDFWCFISDKGIDVEDRMGTLLKLVYLKHTDDDVQAIEPGDVFRYYYSQFESVIGGNVQAHVKSMWTEIVDTFHTLEDWYESPDIYNYVGFLIQSGVSLVTIYQEYEKNLKSENPVPFLTLVEKEIRQLMQDIDMEKEGDGSYRITTEYQNRPKIRKILLLLNINVLSQQLKKINTNNEETLSEANVFKFPFDLYKSQQWDIEHIDSATTNDLKSTEDKKDWVDSSVAEIWGNISQAPKNIQDAYNNGNWDSLIGLIKEDQNEDEEDKNFIGNLTLLDSATNREYQNALFCRKRKYIIQKISEGRYFLTCTQYVFLKFFDDSINSTDRAKWTKADKEKYHSYIVKQLIRFLPEQK